MIDRISFGFVGVERSIPGSLPAARLLDELVRNHPLFGEIHSCRCKDFSTPLWIIVFWLGGHRLAEVVLVETEDRKIRLLKIDATLPTLRYGHNGIPLRSEWDYHLALTRLQELVRPLLGRGVFDCFGNPHWKIQRVEIHVQVHDPAANIILDSHMSHFRYFRTPPMIVPGKSTTFSTKELGITIYDKISELSKDHGDVFEQPITRIEARFKSSRRLRKALGLVESKDGVATIPFDHLFGALESVLVPTVMGGLASPPRTSPPKRRGKIAEILGYEGFPGRLHAELIRTCRDLLPSGASHLRSRVFETLASQCSSSLPALFASGLSDELLVGVRIPGDELGYAKIVDGLDWPTEPDPAVVSVFSELLATSPLVKSQSSKRATPHFHKV